MESFKNLKILTYSRPFDNEFNLRQRYFMTALEEYANKFNGRIEIVSQSQYDKIASFFGKVSQTPKLKRINRLKSFEKLFEKIRMLLEGPLLTPSYYFHKLVGQYLISVNDIEDYKICIELADGWSVVCNDLLNWCDIYFKAGYFSHENYPEKVVPIYHTHPQIIGNLEELYNYRKIKKKYDISFIVRTWCGQSYFEPFEHNMRLIEEISKVDCKKFLYVYLLGGESEAKKVEDKLKKQNIPCGRKPIPMSQSWKISAQSQLNIVRLGVNYFLPWRPFELFAMGACMVFDATPRTIWPVPLVENHNFLSLNLNWCKQPVITGIGYGKSGPDYVEYRREYRRKLVATEEEYLTIPQKIESWLAAKEKIERMSKNNADYFDRYLEPIQIAKYILNTMINREEKDPKKNQK
ncbi:MAG: hypothetical protein GTO02_20075 [Candidatus Dadabacteria bacterium]|nr:hypothetical protein [Candidatus Dadabacteria bacterium]